MVDNYFEGCYFNDKIIDNIGLSRPHGEHLIIFFNEDTNVNDWLNTPSIIKNMKATATSFNFYKFTNRLINELFKHPFERKAFFKPKNSREHALRLLEYHNIIQADLKPCGRLFAHKYKLTKEAKAVSEQEIADGSNPFILKRGDWHPEE